MVGSRFELLRQSLFDNIINATRPPAWRRLTSSRERRRKMGEMEENEEDKPEKDMVVGE